MDWKQACFRKEPAPSPLCLQLPELLLRKLKQVKDKLTCSNSLHIKEQDNRKKQLRNLLKLLLVSYHRSGAVSRASRRAYQLPLARKKHFTSAASKDIFSAAMLNYIFRLTPIVVLRRERRRRSFRALTSFNQRRSCKSFRSVFVGKQV